MSEIRTRQQGSTPFFPNMLNNGSVEVCLKEDVDKVIAEKDKEIALLKERICNGDVSRSTWIDDCFDKDKEIEELKQKLENVNELIKTARQMLEDAKATHYAEMVDAGMRERRLHRALYKACANWAHSNRSFALVLDFKYPENWDEMERKCLKKAEEYK